MLWPHAFNQLFDTAVAVLTFVCVCTVHARLEEEGYCVGVAKVDNSNVVFIIDLKPEPFFAFPPLFPRQQTWRA